MDATSVSLNSVGEVGHAGEGRGVGEGVGGEGELAAAGEGGDDVLVVGPHEGAGEPDGRVGGVVFILCDDGGQVADWVGGGVLMVQAAQGTSRSRGNNILYLMAFIIFILDICWNCCER